MADIEPTEGTAANNAGAGSDEAGGIALHRAPQADIDRMIKEPTSSIPPSQSQTLRAAWVDLVRGFQSYELWLSLGMQDIKQRYRRSVLGPLWITIATGVMALALGLLYSLLFNIPLHDFLPHVTVGLIIWGFISGCVIEGAQTFIANEGLIKQLPASLSVHVYRLVWRQFLFLLHNLVIYVLLMIIFPRPLGWDWFLSIPALALIVINGVWVGMFFGIISTRFRDIAPLLESLIQLAFYVTPIVWTMQTLRDRGGAAGERARIAELNPLMHYLEIVRGPLTGVPVMWYSWVIVGLCTIVGLLITTIAMRQWRGRVSYWV